MILPMHDSNFARGGMRSANKLGFESRDLKAEIWCPQNVNNFRGRNSSVKGVCDDTLCGSARNFWILDWSVLSISKEAENNLFHVSTISRPINTLLFIVLLRGPLIRSDIFLVQRKSSQSLLLPPVWSRKVWAKDKHFLIEVSLFLSPWHQSISSFSLPCWKS